MRNDGAWKGVGKTRTRCKLDVVGGGGRKGKDDNAAHHIHMMHGWFFFFLGILLCMDLMVCPGNIIKVQNGDPIEVFFFFFFFFQFILRSGPIRGRISRWEGGRGFLLVFFSLFSSGLWVGGWMVR